MERISAGTIDVNIGYRVNSLPSWRARCYQFLAIDFWGTLPGSWQRSFSAYYSKIYTTSLSRFLIAPYIRFHYRDRNYLDKFKPPGNKREFKSFQDFFIREFKDPPVSKGKWVWPCEGLLCDSTRAGNNTTSSVKGDRRNLHTIFGLDSSDIPAHYHFTNIFLHNKNYHRIHAPVDGKITRVQHIPGDLVVLRPWIYKQDPSLPAFRNERYNIDIADDHGNTWYMSIVGGPAVGTILLPDSVSPGAEIGKLEELATFLLGSTCCMAAPVAPRFHRLNSFVAVGDCY